MIGAGAGLSTAAGFMYSGDFFKEHFADFEEKYGFHDMYSGGFYPFSSREEFWAFWSRNIYLNRYTERDNGTYKMLLDLFDYKVTPLLAFRPLNLYRTGVRLRVLKDEIYLRFSASAYCLSNLTIA